MSNEEIELHDRQLVSTHEIGHVVVALAKGVYVERVWLERTGTADRLNVKTWVGHTSMYCGPARQLAPCIGIAGIVGEEFADNELITAEEILDGWRYGDLAPSPSDLVGMPSPWAARLAVVREALGIISEHRELFHGLIADLIEQDSLVLSQLPTPSTMLRKK